MAVPVPLDATAGDRGSATAFDAGVRDVFLWLMQNAPRCHVYAGTTVACANATPTLITWDAETYDNYAMHSTTTNTSRIVMPETGLYEVDIQVVLPTATYAAGSVMRVTLNAAGAYGGGTNLRTPDINQSGATNYAVLRFCRQFTAGDYIEVFISQDSGASRNISATSLGSRVFARWIGS